MNTEELNRLAEQLHGELTGDRDHDRALLLAWAERYRGSEQAAPLLREIGLLLYRLDEEDLAPMTEEALEERLRRGEEALSAATDLIQAERYEEALELLTPFIKEIDSFSLPDDCLWMDFHSYLDGLLYEDFFQEEIAGREIRRHPLRPAHLLFAYAGALDGLDRSAESIEALEHLVTLDPVCPDYLCSLGRGYLAAGKLQDAWDTGCWALVCASTREEAAGCYWLLALCLAEDGLWEDADLLCQKSLLVQATPYAEEALAGIRRQTGSDKNASAEDINRRCQELDIPIGRSEAVEKNMKFLESFFS